MMRNKLRWLPAIAVPALIAAGVVAANASADVTLPERSAAEVVAMAAEHADTSFSGTVEQVSNLGLPELPADGKLAAPEASQALEWLSGSHSVRLFVDGPDKARVQVMDRLAERDLVVNASDVWLYNSRQKTAVHAALPAGEGTADSPRDSQLNPVDLAGRLLSKLDSSTDVALGANVKVAGRAAYDLVLTPRTPDTLVGSVSVAVDGKTGMPLSVRVVARGQNDPAISVAFTELSYETPAARMFTFTPPHGTTVTEHPVPDASTLPMHPDAPQIAGPTAPTISGSDWSTVVAFPSGSAPAGILDSPLLAKLTTAIDGGRLISTSLLNVLITDSGRVIAGAVPVHLLQAAVTSQ
jgi:outer membrane lipoprotein-sorting protein